MLAARFMVKPSCTTLLMRPPMVWSASSTVTSKPPCWSRKAAVRPEMPAPMTMARGPPGARPAAVTAWSDRASVTSAELVGEAVGLEEGLVAREGGLHGRQQLHGFGHRAGDGHLPPGHGGGHVQLS